MSTAATATAPATSSCLWCTETTCDTHSVCAGCRAADVVHRDELAHLTVVQALTTEAEAVATGGAVVQ